MHEHISALGKAAEPDFERIEYLFKRASRLASLRRQVERLEDELELELISSGSGRAMAERPRPDVGEVCHDVTELRRDVDELQAEAARPAHWQPPRALRRHCW
jgi:polyhydroxyalkanoate synthesis regulator phasin